MKVSVKKSQAAAADFLTAYAGEKGVTGKLYFDFKRKIWTISVLCFTTRGVFLGEKIELDEVCEIFMPVWKRVHSGGRGTIETVAGRGTCV